MALRFRTLFLAIFCLTLGWALPCRAQGAPPSAPPDVAAQVPLSGRPVAAGAVQAAESPVPGVTTTVNTISPQVQVTGAFAGSAVSTAHLPFSGRLSLRDAIQRGLDYNLGQLSLDRSVQQAGGEVRVARSSLLPNLSASLTENVQQTDLAALGLRVNSPFPGFSIPSIVGPFNYFELQASLSQTVANFTDRANYHASQTELQAAQWSARDARDLVVLAVGAAYLQVIASKARLASARAQLATADAILQQSERQHGAGTLAQLPLDQNQVQALTQQQQLTTLENELAKQKINLARMVGLPPNDNFDISDDVPFAPAPPLNVETAVAQALAQRSDLKAAEAALQAARQARSAAGAERMPNASISADYGVIGTNPSRSHGVFTLVGSVNLPLWQGGRAGGDMQVADAAVQQRQSELEDTSSQVEAQVREAFLDLQAAASQVDVAQRNLQTAQETLEMTRLRFNAGVINTVELVQAQQSVAVAQLDYINSVYAHNLAKLSLARALGTAAESWPRFLNLAPAPPPK